MITFITAATLAQRDLRATMLAGFRIFVKRLLSQRFRKTFWPLEDIRKPALMRALFPARRNVFRARTLVYQDARAAARCGQYGDGFAHYLDLLDRAGMLCGIQKYDAKEVRRRKSSPRFMVYDTSLMTASSGIEKSEIFG